MSTGEKRAARVTVMAAVVILAATSCVDERVVFRNRDLIGTLPPGVQGFLGYDQAPDPNLSDPENAPLTICGNCHVGQQSAWELTAHAHAWQTLQASGHASAACEGCHTVNQLGNPLDSGPAGFLAVRDPRYRDVQCESCHGPGLNHVQNPDATQPLAPITVGTNLTEGCGECHQGSHHPFVEEWEQSRHGRVLASPAGRAECQGCHTAQAALLALGVRDEYLEKGSTQPLPIVCAVCHDPHSNEFDGQLRYPIDQPNEEENLCMRCHHKRGGPEPTSTRGPHSPEGPLLLGEAGWWPPNMPIEPGTEIVGTHGSQANPRLCAGCHVQAFQVTDRLTGQFLVASVGHLFQAIPCLDPQGVPTTDDTCALTERSFRSCVQSGCHGSEAAARSAYTVAQNRILTLANRLNAMLAQVPASEFSDTDGRYTTAEGTRFNYELATFPGSFVHNPFLLEALLVASIQQVNTEYGVPIPAGTVLTQQLAPG